MRTLVAVFLLVGTLLAVQPAGAQDLSALLEDAAGDVRLDVDGSQALPDAADLYASADLRSLAIRETRTEIEFVLTVDDLKPAQEQTAPDGFVANILFLHNGREFRVSTGHGFTVIGNTFWGSLSQRDASTAEWSTTWFSFDEVRADFAAETLTIPVSRELLADANGAAPFPGRSLDGIHVRATSQLMRDTPIFSGDPFPAVTSPVVIVDDMPDDPNAAASYAIQLGVVQTGHAFLSSDMPFRASNGEATTYIITAKAENLGDSPDTFAFRVVGASNQLTVIVPIQVLALDAGAQYEVPVLATVPFGHRHGDVESFVLEMVSETDPGSIGRIEMGIRFLAVPQPAGHHDTLYLHTVQQFGVGPVLPFHQGIMSTLEDDPTTEPQLYYSSGNGGFVGGWTHYFYYRLQPSLEIGLDFDLDRGGKLVLPVGSTEPMLGATVTGDLYVWSSDTQDRTTIAVLGPTEPVDIDPNDQHLFELEFEVDDDADRIPVEKGMQLFLNLRVTTLAAAPTFGTVETGPYIAPGGWLKLPLNEWHDDVDDVLAALSGPGLSPLGAQERLVNPGKAAIFHVSIANPTDKTARVLLEVSGPNAEWATLPATSVDVPAHDTARASVVVRAPAGTVNGERADLVLQAYSKDDPAARGLLRFVTIVDTDAQHPDDTAAADELAEKESPGLGPALSFGAVALLALVLRRRR